MPTHPRKKLKYPGCLEKVKMPLLIGLSVGAVANEIPNISPIMSARRQIGRPIDNHKVSNFRGKNRL